MPRGWLPAVWGPFFKKMKIKCGYFLVVERTTLENLSSTSHVISRSRGVWAPPFKQEERSVRSQSRAGESGLHCQPAVQSPSALKVLPPRWSTRWCPCHLSDTQTGSHWSGWSLQMPRIPCFCWASVHCGEKWQLHKLAERRQFFGFLPKPHYQLYVGCNLPGDTSPYLSHLFINLSALLRHCLFSVLAWICPCR